MGRIEATLNFASVIQLPKIGRILNHTFFDVYTVLVEDVQVFVEKRNNIFNFHLLDASLDIPDHTLVMEDYNKLTKRKQEPRGINDEGLGFSKSVSSDREEERGDLVGVREEGTLIREREDKANKIVEKLVRPFSSRNKLVVCPLTTANIIVYIPGRSCFKDRKSSKRRGIERSPIGLDESEGWVGSKSKTTSYTKIKDGFFFFY